MWLQRSKQRKDANERVKEQRKRPAKREMTPLEKAKREYALWVLAEEYEEEDQ